MTSYFLGGALGLSDDSGHHAPLPLWSISYQPLDTKTYPKGPYYQATLHAASQFEATESFKAREKYLGVPIVGKGVMPLLPTAIPNGIWVVKQIK